MTTLDHKASQLAQSASHADAVASGWQHACARRMWTDEEKIIHLLGFIAQAGLNEALKDYALGIAAREVQDEIYMALEWAGYRFNTTTNDGGNLRSWGWAYEATVSKVTFTTRDGVLQDALNHARAQVCATTGESAQAWAARSLTSQLDAVREILAGD